MNTKTVPSLRDPLVEVPGFRQVRRRRYELRSVLLFFWCGLLACGKGMFADGDSLANLHKALTLGLQFFNLPQ